MPNTFRATATAAVRPFWYVRDAGGNMFARSFWFLHTHARLVEENQTLKEENALLRSEQDTYAAIQKSHDLLLGLPNTYVPLKVISRPPFTSYDVLVVTVPKEQSLHLGDAIYAASSTVVGLVSAVAPQTAHISLFSSSGMVREGIIGRTRESVSVQGVGNGAFELYIPKDVDIVIGDQIVDTYTDSILGTIISINPDQDGSFKRVYVRARHIYSKLEWVYIRQ